MAEEVKEQPIAAVKPAAGGKKPVLKIISLGGLNEIGKNMYLIETANDIVRIT